MGSGLTRMRAGAAIAGVSATTLLLTALPASAATHGELGSDQVTGDKITLEKKIGGKNHYDTILMGLDLADSDESLDVYCVDIENSAQYNRRMNERDWDDYPSSSNVTFDENRAEINWILHNSFPQAELDDLSDAVNDSDDTDGLNGTLSKETAVTATQAAIWYYSDGANLAEDSNDHDVVATYNYLTGDANTGLEQPAASLEIDTDRVEGNAGDTVGPIELGTNGEISDVTVDLPDGVEVTDADGETLDVAELTDGDEFYLDVPEDVGDGSVEITVAAEKTEVDVGRLFVAENFDRDPAQSLIAATSGSTGSEHSATVSWGPAPEETTPPETSESETPKTSESETESAAPETSETNEASEQETEDLAYTGASVMAPVLIGVGLLAAGGVALFLVRRRQRA